LYQGEQGGKHNLNFKGNLAAMANTPVTSLANKRNELLIQMRISRRKNGVKFDPVEAYAARHGETPSKAGIDIDAITAAEIKAAPQPDKSFAEWMRVYKRKLKLKPLPDKCARCHSIDFIEHHTLPPHYKKIICGVCERCLHWVSRYRDIDLRTYRPKT
jgi:hypothetical protein